MDASYYRTRLRGKVLDIIFCNKLTRYAMFFEHGVYPLHELIDRIAIEHSSESIDPSTGNVKLILESGDLEFRFERRGDGEVEKYWILLHVKEKKTWDTFLDSPEKLQAFFLRNLMGKRLIVQTGKALNTKSKKMFRAEIIDMDGDFFPQPTYVMDIDYAEVATDHVLGSNDLYLVLHRDALKMTFHYKNDIYRSPYFALTRIDVEE